MAQRLGNDGGGAASWVRARGKERVNVGLGREVGGPGSSPRRSCDVREASRGGVGAVCPRGAHAVSKGVAVVGTEIGQTDEAHESARGRVSESSLCPGTGSGCRLEGGGG
jgi:hypothetical protein